MPRVADLLHRRIIARQAPPPQEDKEEPTEQPAPAPSDEELAEAVEVRGLFPLLLTPQSKFTQRISRGQDALAKSPSSLVLHLLAASFYQDAKEWEALLQVSESGLSIVGRTETEIGRPLARSVCLPLRSERSN